MKMNKSRIQCLLLSLATVKLCGAFTAIPSLNTRIVTFGVTNNDNDVIDIGLFRTNSQSPYERNKNQRNLQEKKHTQGFTESIFRKLKTVRSILRFRLSSRFWNINKKRYLSIIASAIIVAGTFPSQVTAQLATNGIPSVNSAPKISRTVSETHFVQDLDSSDNHMFDGFDTEGLASHDDEFAIDAEDFRFARPAVEDVSQTLAAEASHPLETDLMVLNDIMVKKGLRNIAVVGTGAVSLTLLKKKANASSLISGEESKIDDGRPQNVGEETILPDREERTGAIALSEAKKSSILPLGGKKYVEARAQPKSPLKEAELAARYAAISSVEERAYQILIDLGMIEVTN